MPDAISLRPSDIPLYGAIGDRPRVTKCWNCRKEEKKERPNSSRQKIFSLGFVGRGKKRDQEAEFRHAFAPVVSGGTERPRRYSITRSNIWPG